MVDIETKINIRNLYQQYISYNSVAGDIYKSNFLAQSLKVLVEDNVLFLLHVPIISILLVLEFQITSTNLCNFLKITTFNKENPAIKLKGPLIFGSSTKHFFPLTYLFFQICS